MATTIRWHAAGTILACAGRVDVYVEKPASQNIREGRLMIQAAQGYKRVVQVGMPSRSRAGDPTISKYVQTP